MVHKPDVTLVIRGFLMSHAGQHCETCLAEGTGLDPKAVKTAFKPSKDHPYSFMPTCCDGCRTTQLCVAFVGDRDTITGKQAAVALMGTHD